MKSALVLLWLQLLATFLWISQVSGTRTSYKDHLSVPRSSWEWSGEYYLPSAAELEANWQSNEKEESSTIDTFVEGSSASSTLSNKRKNPTIGMRSQEKHDYHLALGMKFQGRKKKDLNEEEKEGLVVTRQYFNNRLFRDREPGAVTDAIRLEARQVLNNLPGSEGHIRWNDFIGPLRPEDEQRRNRTVKRRKYKAKQKMRKYMKEELDTGLPAPTRGRPPKPQSDQGKGTVKGKGKAEKSSRSDNWNILDTSQDHVTMLHQDLGQPESQFEKSRTNDRNLAETLPSTWAGRRSRYKNHD